MQEILEGTEGVNCQMDDVLVDEKGTRTHDERLLVALEKMSDAGATLNDPKTFIGENSLDYLGRIVGDHGIKKNPEKGKGRTNATPN